jgi:hypothetical protein
MICEACGEKEATCVVDRTNLYKGKPFSRQDRICQACLGVYYKWEKEGRFLDLRVKSLSSQ